MTTKIDRKNTSAKLMPLNTVALPRIISMFSGSGGLDWGFHKEGFGIALAIDISPAAIETHGHNFKDSKGIVADLSELGPAGVLDEAKKCIPLGERIGVIGGPPCQGFSRANTLSCATDPRNKLPALYLEIVEALKREYIVEFVVFENVLGIRDAKHSATYKSIVDGLNRLDFSVTEKELCAIDFGVPQARRRVILSALRSNGNYPAVKPAPRKGKLTVRDAIGDLCEPALFRRGIKKCEIPHHPNHWTMFPKSSKFKRPEQVNNNGRSFKRLLWDVPSRTIAFGHREIPVHPEGHRRISIFEARIIQGFPKGFVLKGNLLQQAEQISNAVPPPMARSIAAAVKKSLARN